MTKFKRNQNDWTKNPNILLDIEKQCRIPKTDTNIGNFVLNKSIRCLILPIKISFPDPKSGGASV